MITIPAGYKPVTTPCQANPDLWYSNISSERREAKKICSSCPFKVDCLKTATENGETHGIWGGKNFSNDTTVAASTRNKTCRSGKHNKDYAGTCKQCRAETQRRYDQKITREKGTAYQNKQKHKNKKKKNEIGKMCRNGKHMLSKDNTRVRAYDSSLVCVPCASASKTRFFQKGFS